jgi:Fic family protein
MEATIQTIDKLAAVLQELQPLNPEYQQRLDKKIRLEFNYNSNHIEGNTLTYGETELLLIFDKTTGNHELREYEEMKSHDVAFEMIKEWAADKERPLTEAAIKNLHEVLLVRPFWKEALTVDGQPTRRLIKIGAYKEHPNSVRLQNGEIFHYASPNETPIQMGELINWFRKEEEKGELHPVVLAALLHYKFVRIHPFDDGNGRISRLLMNYVLLKNNLPPVVIKSADKKNYLFSLNQADAGDVDAFVEYVATQTILSLELSIKAAKGENIEEQEDWEKKVRLLKRADTRDNKVVPRSVDAVLDIINHSAIPLINQTIEKLALYDELFAEKRLLFGDGKTSRLMTTSELISRLLESDNDRYMNGINFRYELNGYKFDGINTFSAAIELGWQFDQFKYYFFFDHNDREKAMARLYQQNFSDDEINGFANACGQKMMEKIEERLSTNK